MSIESWKAEFYPVSASEVSKEDALDHSIRKWEGLTKENLRRHGLKPNGDSLVERGGDDDVADFYVTSETCALCETYQKQANAWSCGACPLFADRGGACCEAVGREKLSPYEKFTAKRDPIPMLNLLKRVKAKQEAEKQP